MRKVKRTKIPSQKQMQNMAQNLEGKFKRPSLIQSLVWGKSMHEPIYYYLYVEDTYNERDLTWTDLQDKYFELMEGKDA